MVAVNVSLHHPTHNVESELFAVKIMVGGQRNLDFTLFLPPFRKVTNFTKGGNGGGNGKKAGVLPTFLVGIDKGLREVI